MKSHTTDRFWDCYKDLPKSIQNRAQKAYRALGVKSDDHTIWFWIGSHDDYEQLLKQM